MAEPGEPAPGAGSPADPRGPGARAATSRRRAGRESALVALLLLALAVLLTWPATPYLGSMVPDLGDPILTTWILAWDVHALTAAPLRLFDANMFHPRRWTLAYTEHLLGLVPLAWAARSMGADLLHAHNLVWLATFPMTGLTLFWLVRHLTGHAGAATLAAILYAFSHFRFGQLGHVQVLSHQWLPLMLLGLHRAAETRGRGRDLGLAAGAFALQALSSGYQAFFAATAGVLFLAWVGLPTTRPPLARLITRTTIATVLAALVLSPFFLPYRFVHAEIGLSRNFDEFAHHVARPASYLAAPAENRWLGEITAPFRTGGAALWPGFVVLGLALPGMALAWMREAAPSADGRRRPRWLDALDTAVALVILLTLANWLFLGGFSVRLGPFRLSQRNFAWPLFGLVTVLVVRRLILRGPVPIRGLGWLGRLGWPSAPGYYVGLTLVGVILSFGPWLELGRAGRLRPLYHQLYGLVPSFDALRVPGRFGVLVTTGLAVLAGFAAATVVRRFPDARWRRATLLALGVLAALEAWTVPLRFATVPPGPALADRWLAAQPGAEAVLVLPMYEPRVSHLESLRLLDSTAHWRPLVNGYAGVLPPGYAADVAVLNTFPAPAAVARLRAIHVRYVVVHLGQDDSELDMRRAIAPERLPPGVTRVADFPYTQVFEIGPEGARTSG